MTVIAGASLFNGVILLSDTRATIRASGKPDIHCDIAQKLFPLTPSTAIGFCGDVRAASFLLYNAIHQLKSRPRKDATSLAQWLPRFLRSAYQAFDKRHGAEPVSFMVGSVITDRPNVVERQKVAELLQTISFGNPRVKRSFIPDIVVRIMMTPAEATMIAIPGSVRGLLYTLHSPDFVPKQHAPLGYCAVGSGQGAVREIADTADWLLAGEPGNDLIESMALTDAVSEFIAAEEIEGVGGMYTCIKLDQRGVSCLGHKWGFPGQRVSIQFDQSTGRWLQKNEATGKEIQLMHPWEIEPRSIKADQRFDDWEDAVRAFNPRRLQRKRP
jgi:hypothetical protein